MEREWKRNCPDLVWGVMRRTILRAQVWGTKVEEYPALALGILTGVPKELDNLVLLWGLMGRGNLSSVLGLRSLGDGLPLGTLSRPGLKLETACGLLTSLRSDVLIWRGGIL